MNSIVTAPPTSVEETVNKITKAYAKTLEASLETGREIYQASQNKKEFGQVRKSLVEKRVMSASTISSFIKIGQCELLHDEAYADKLPRSYTSLYKLTTLGNDKLKELLDSGSITADMTVKEIDFLVGINKSPQVSPQKAAPEVRSEPECVISIPESTYKKHKQEIDKLKKLIAKDYSFLELTIGGEQLNNVQN